MRASPVIYGLLKAQPVVNIAGDRVYPNVAPAGAEVAGPFIVFSLTSTARETHLRGTSGIVKRTYEVVCACRDYDQSDALADAVIGSLESWRGTEGDMKVRRVTIESESDDYDRPEDGSDSIIHIRRIGVVVDHLTDTTSLPAGS